MKSLRHSNLWGEPGEVIDRLTGRWSLRRRIDGTGADRGSLGGIADFRPLEHGRVGYHEEGRLRLANGHEFDARRDYLYDRLALGFAVFFNEAPYRLFHEVHLHREESGALHGRARHLCGPDCYSTEYLFECDGGFLIRHKVRGPRKDYTMTTAYRRIADPDRA